MKKLSEQFAKFYLKDLGDKFFLRRLFLFKKYKIEEVFLVANKEDWLIKPVWYIDDYNKIDGEKFYKFDVRPESIDDIKLFNVLLETNSPLQEEIKSESDNYWFRINKVPSPAWYLTNLFDDHAGRENGKMKLNYYSEMGYKMFFSGLSGIYLTDDIYKGILNVRQHCFKVEDIDNDFNELREGYKFAARYFFLKTQKDRLDRGEDITKPDSEIIEKVEVVLVDGGKTPLLAKTTDIALYVYFLGKIGVDKEIELNAGNDSKMQYRKYIEIFNRTFGDNAYKLDSVKQGLTEYEFALKKNCKLTEYKQIQKLSNVRSYLLTHHPEQSGIISNVFEPYLS